MNFIKNSQTFATGLAMFSMFFGAGNVIFPLAIGHYAQDKTFYAIIGLLITAVAVPFMGLIAMILYKGDYQFFFGRIGKIPGFIVSLLIMLLLGPLGSTPRCVALSFSTLKQSIPEISSVPYGLIACLIIYLLACKKNRILDLLGYGLTPILLGSLTFIIIKGLLVPGIPEASIENGLSAFFHGLNEGYNTMDLLAAFFFSSVILDALKRTHFYENGDILYPALKATFIGGCLLALVYTGFSYIASFHGSLLSVHADDELLGALTMKIIGASAGLIVNITVILACLTTAVALASVFADFLDKEIFNKKIGYNRALGITMVITFGISTLEFTGIAAFLQPMLQICYPALIVLTLLNIAHKLMGIQSIKAPVFLTFIITIATHLFYKGNFYEYLRGIL
jgi:branched-chain amino acid:cation transporter, LIVCS family